MTSDDWKDLADMVDKAWQDAEADTISASTLVSLLREKAKTVEVSEDLDRMREADRP